MPSVKVEFCVPEVKVCGTPSIIMVARKGPVPFPSTRKSNFCPTKKRAESGGVTVTFVGNAKTAVVALLTITSRQLRSILLIREFICSSYLSENEGVEIISLVLR